MLTVKYFEILRKFGGLGIIKINCLLSDDVELQLFAGKIRTLNLRCRDCLKAHNQYGTRSDESVK